MKFLVDECTGTSVVACLRDEGHDAVAVVEVMPEADDLEILDWAVFEGRIVVTNDKDFGELVYRSGWEHRGVVLLRLRDERAENKVRMMKVVLAQVGELLRNHYVVATEAGIRVRK
jgi:predicted nuclease of predicted toxin-antitoxin system